MSYHLCCVALAPLRREPSDASEMVSQLLFGEALEVLEELPRWQRVRCAHDGYEGWMDPKQALYYGELSESDAACPLAFGPVSWLSRGEKRQWLPMGAPLRGLTADGSLEWFGEKAHFEGESRIPLRSERPSADFFVEVLKCFFHAPYLWGGRSPLGVDCSGLVQQAFRFLGHSLPRDAYQQALEGDPVDFGDRTFGDLCFFRNDAGRVVHVGILFTDGRILHASGEVRLDRLGEEGIFREKEGVWSHRRPELRRLARFFRGIS